MIFGKDFSVRTVKGWTCFRYANTEAAGERNGQSKMMYLFCRQWEKHATKRNRFLIFVYSNQYQILSTIFRLFWYQMEFSLLLDHWEIGKQKLISVSLISPQERSPQEISP